MSRLRVGSQTWTQRETHTQGATMATVGSIHAVIANMGTMKKSNICDQCVDASHYCHGCHLCVNVSRCVHVCRLGVDISHYSHDCRLCVDISLCVHVYHPCMDISNDSHYWHLCYFWSHLGPSWNPFGGLPEQIINDLGSHSEPSRATILCWKQFGATNRIHEKALEGKWEDIRLGKRCKGKTR